MWCPLAYISSLTQLHPPYLDQILVVLGNLLWSQNDGKMSRSKLTATSNCSPHPHRTLQSVWAHWYVVHWHTADSSNLTQLYPPYLDQIFVVLGNLLWSQNDVIMSRLRLIATSNCFLHQHETYQRVWAHCYAVHWHTTDNSSLTQL